MLFAECGINHRFVRYGFERQMAVSHVGKRPNAKLERNSDYHTHTHKKEKQNKTKQQVQNLDKVKIVFVLEGQVIPDINVVRF